MVQEGYIIGQIQFTLQISSEAGARIYSACTTYLDGDAAACSCNVSMQFEDSTIIHRMLKLTKLTASILLLIGDH